MLNYPYCQVIAESDCCFYVDGRHYEQLKDMIDRKEKGWVELDSVFDESAKVMVRLDTIEHIIYVTETFDRMRQAMSVTNA